MLFQPQGRAVANYRTRLKEGKKPVIAFASTMENSWANGERTGLAVGDGDLINMDFSEVLRGVGWSAAVHRDINGASHTKIWARQNGFSKARLITTVFLKKINRVNTGITISPIDVIIKKLIDPDFLLLITGRKLSCTTPAGNKRNGNGTKEDSTNDAFPVCFNNNEVDVLMINQSGSTGESARYCYAKSTKGTGETACDDRLCRRSDINIEDAESAVV